MQELSVAGLAAPFASIRVWRVELDSAAHDLANTWLSPSERLRAARFAFARDAQRYRAAHIALRELLYQCFGLEPQVEFKIGPHGKPEIAGSATIGFSLSHSGGQAIIAISGEADIGVDIEVLRPVADMWTLAEHNLDATELNALRGLPEQECAGAFLAAWTRKEACLKALGVGLTIRPVDVHVGFGGGPTMWTSRVGDEASVVWVQAIEAGEDVLAAIATAAKLARCALDDHE